MPVNDRWVSLAELASETGYVTRTLQYIRTQEPGVLVYRQRGKVTEYQQPACAINLRKREVEKAVNDAAPADFEEARARKVAAEAQKVELELAQLRGQLVTTADFQKALASAFDRVRARVVALPGRLAPLVVGLTTLPAAVAAIEPVIAEVLQELATDPTPVLEDEAA